MSEPGSEPSGQLDGEPGAAPAGHADGGPSVGRAEVPVVGRARPASRRARGTAPKPDTSTKYLERPDVTAPIFVDGSGRRRRRLRRVAYWVIAVVLILLALWWLSQVTVATEVH